MIDDIVSMAAACARAKVGRAIDVADAERIEIGHERAGVGEREIAMQLQAISCARNIRRTGVPVRDRRFASARAQQRRCKPLEARVRAPLLERQRKLAPPVRMRIDRRRKVYLLARADDILELHYHQLRRSARKEDLDRARELIGHPRRRDGIGADSFRQQAFALERAQQPGSIERSLAQLLRLRVVGGKQAEICTKIDVEPFPPTAKRRKVVRARGDDRLLRIFRGALEFTRLIALE